MNDHLLPKKGEILEVIQETGSNLDIKTFRLKYADPSDQDAFDFAPGQFMELTVYGVGEAPFGLASSPTQKNSFDISIKKMGLVTKALHNMKAGDFIGLRGPYGNSFPYQEAQGKDIVFVGGGIGIAPLRSLINYVLDPQKRDLYGSVQLLLAFRSPEDMLYRQDYLKWEASPNTTVKYTIDEPCEGWTHCVGYPHAILLQELKINPENTLVFTCGPPIMIKFVTKILTDANVPPENIITTLEARMSCGVGRCGRCNIGPHYICKDGPVFSQAQLEKMPQEY